jgi:hypothetical protein
VAEDEAVARVVGVAPEMESLTTKIAKCTKFEKKEVIGDTCQ